MTKVYVNLACGDTYVESWVNLDYAPDTPLVKKANLLARLPFADESVDVIYSSHFVEHISRQRIRDFLLECFRILKPGGNIRLVLPDLEEMCDEYLRQRRSSNHDKADFVIMEIIDQCVRTKPGGSLDLFYSSLISNSEKEKLREYVSYRTGENFSVYKDRSPRLLSENLRKHLVNPGLFWGKMERLYCKALLAFMPKVFREQNVSFTGPGEKHLWLYDYHTLSVHLSDAGFYEVSRYSHDSSGIDGFSLYPLDVTSDGKPRKGAESMYIEAKKPS